MSDEFTLTSPVPVGGRESHDHFPTPRFCTEALFEHAHEVCERWPDARSVLDPAAGEGAILDVARKWGFTTYGLELDPVRAEAARARGHQIATGSALYVPCSGRGGVEDGGDSAWADAPDLDSLIERYLDGDGAEAEGDEDEV